MVILLNVSNIKVDTTSVDVSSRWIDTTGVGSSSRQAKLDPLGGRLRAEPEPVVAD